MIDQTKNIMIGLFVIAACAIITFIVLFLHPSVGDEGKTLKVRFSNIDKINVGTRVTFAGRPVGEVVDITEIPAAIQHRKGRDGLVYVYELKLVTDSKINVFNTDTIAARTSGLLGEKSVEITPHPVMPGECLRNVSDEILYADEVGSVEDTFKELTEVANRVDAALDAVTELLNQVKEDKLIKHISRTFDHLGNIMETLDKPDELSETVTHVHQFTKKLNHKWDNVNSAIDNVSSACGGVCKITDKICACEGTIGRLIFADDCYLRTNCILSKAETLMDDVNHYGLLFHLDKGWQRLRARRLNLLNRLSTPQEFRNFFNDEINQISTSLSRVSMVLDKQCGCPPYDSNFACFEFNKVFAELMRRVEGLEESLQLYNQQLSDRETRKTELCPS